MFDLVSGAVRARLAGSAEEVRSMRLVPFKGEWFLVTSGQEGYIRKWKLNSADWRFALSFACAVGAYLLL